MEKGFQKNISLIFLDLLLIKWILYVSYVVGVDPSLTNAVFYQ